MNGSSMSRTIVAVVAIFIIGLVIFSIGQFGESLTPKPVVDAKLTTNRDKFKTTESAIMTLYLKNNEDTNGHAVRLKFITNPLVHVYLGSNELAKQDNYTYTYNTSVAPSQKMEQPLVITMPSLPIGIAEQRFSITMEVYLDNSQENSVTQEIRFSVEK